MNKTENDKTEQLLNTIYKAFSLLRSTLNTSEAFIIVFSLLYYKRFNDILEKSDQFDFDETADVCSEDILPEENRWHHLLKTPPLQQFKHITENIKKGLVYLDKKSLNLTSTQIHLME